MNAVHHTVMTEALSSERSTNYRERIYTDYAQVFQDAGAEFDVLAARRWARPYRWLLRDWLPTAVGSSVVDLGCGGGDLLLFFRDEGFRDLQGVDVSPSQVAIARQMFPQVVQQDLFAFLQQGQSRFDVITAFDVIEHLTKDEALRFLDLCRRRLASGGRLILQSPNADSPFGMTLRYGDFTHETCFNPNSLSRLLTVAGFTKVECREVEPVPFGYSAAASVRWLLWRAVRVIIRALNVIETGGPGSGIFSRVFLVSAIV